MLPWLPSFPTERTGSMRGESAPRIFWPHFMALKHLSLRQVSGSQDYVWQFCARKHRTKLWVSRGRRMFAHKDGDNLSFPWFQPRLRFIGAGHMMERLPRGPAQCKRRTANIPEPPEPPACYAPGDGSGNPFKQPDHAHRSRLAMCGDLRARCDLTAVFTVILVRPQQHLFIRQSGFPTEP